MPVDPKSIAAGKRYVTATGHQRTVLEVTDERVRYAYGGGESGGVSQWRWQWKGKFAEDVVKEVATEEPTAGTEKQKIKSEPRAPGARKILSKP
jgi:hypothetical protein